TICAPYAQVSSENEQGVADGLDDALGVDLGVVGSLLGLFQGGHVDKRDDHAVNDVLHRAVGQKAHEVVSVDIHQAQLAFPRGERGQHVQGLADEVGADEALGKVGDGPANVTGSES